MGLNKFYDFVSATFPIAYLYDGNSRFDFIPELQICVKNSRVIEKIEIYNYNKNSEYYRSFVNLYRKVKKEALGSQKKKGTI